MEKTKSVAFTGHCTQKIMAFAKNPNILNSLAALLDKTVANLHERGYTTFYQGMSEGFDLLCAEAVLRLRIKHPGIRLIAVVPFMGQELGYCPRDKERCNIIYELASKVVFTSQEFHGNVYFVRNDYLIAHSSLVVCYYNPGLRGDTMDTVNRAKEQGLAVINLADLVV